MATPYAWTRLTEVDSTQDEARTRFDGTPQLVVAERQRHGRGRLGRHWDQAPRALAASLAFQPAWPADTWPRLTLTAGLAALDALPGELSLRWPNDVYLDGRKAAGILVEGSDGVVVAGLGANLWWPDPPSDRVGIFTRDPGPERAGELAKSWAESLLRRVEAGPDQWGRREAVERSTTLGRQVSLPDGTRASAVGIAEDGSLLVERSGRTWPVRTGPVSVDEGTGHAR